MPTVPDKDSKDSSSSDPVIDPTKKTWQDQPPDGAPAGEEPAEPDDDTVSPDKKTWQ